MAQAFVGTRIAQGSEFSLQFLFVSGIHHQLPARLADTVMDMEGGGARTASQTGSLTCTLLDRRSSVPLSGARITCVWRGDRISRLDADKRGNFTTELPQGVYDLVISARGYLSLTVRGVGVLGGYEQVLTRGLVPGEGQDPEGVPSTAIGGFITDRIERPVGNVTVSAIGDDGSASYTTRTDRSGAYILHGVVPGMYDLSVRSRERTLAHEPVPIAHVKDFIRLDLRLPQI
ncbi:MAG: hypothetical protein NVSMB64_24460 [Candidatus Velthaea sp.]